MKFISLSVGLGQPEFIQEADNTYFFKWLTSLVCPDSPVECLIFNDKNNQQYDLSRYMHCNLIGISDTYVKL